MAGASGSLRGGFPWGLRQFVRPSSPSWTLPLHLTLLLTHHSSHGLSFPQPPLSPRYLDLFLMPLLFFLLVLLPSVKRLTFHSVIGISWVLLLPWLPWLPRWPLRGSREHPGSAAAASPAARPALGTTNMPRRALRSDRVQRDLAPAKEPLSPGGGVGDRPLSRSSSSGAVIPA